jgi:hypothetical protein
VYWFKYIKKGSLRANTITDILLEPINRAIQGREDGSSGERMGMAYIISKVIGNLK